MGEHRQRGEKGAALAELAMVLPIAMALLLAIFTGGSAYFKKISLVDAARDGARYGASLKVQVGGLADWKLAVQNRVAALSGDQLTASDVCAELVIPTGTNVICGVADPNGAASDPTVLTPASIVKVSVQKSVKLEFIFFSSNPTLSAKVAARYERDII